MELLLNVVWVLIGGLALWSFLGSSSRSQKRFLFALVALFCAVLLLFQAFVSEDSSASKWLPSAAPTSPIEYWATLLLAILLALFHRSFWFIRKTKSFLRLSTLLDRPVLGR